MAPVAPRRAGLIQRMAAAWSVLKAGGSTQTLSLTDPRGWSAVSGGSTYTGKPVTPDTAMQISVVWACVKILAESVAALPLALYRRDDNGNATKVDDHPLVDVLMRQPNADMTSMEYREAGQVNLGLAGNAYSMVERRGARLVSLYPLLAQAVRPVRERETGAVAYEVNEDGRWVKYPAEKIWHVRGLSSTGLVGYSPIGQMRQAMGLSLAAEQFGADLFARGAYPSLVVRIQSWLTGDQRKAANDKLAEMHAGLANAHKPYLLEGGMEFDKSASMMPPEDLQLLELRRFQLHEICRLYRVPPHMVADLERATFSNIEQMSLEFVTYTLLPWLRRWETSAERWLLSPAERGRYFLRHNFEGLLRADSDGRAKLYATYLQNGVMSRNEVRGLENLNRIDGLDDHTVQTNMVPVDRLGELADAQIEKSQSVAHPEPAAAPVAAAPKTLVIATPPAGGPRDPVDVKTGDTHVQVVLPENLKHELQKLDEPRLIDIAEQARRTAEAVVHMGEKLELGLAAVAKEVAKPRVPVLNREGEIIGSVTADSIH